MLLNKKEIKDVFNILDKYYKNSADTELKYINPYTLLVAVVLSAQATDKGVNKATKDLFNFIDTPEKMVKLGENNLKEYIKSINYCNVKAKHIISLSKKLIENFNSKVPNNIKDLISLDGVGRKTANIILNTVFGITSIAVDTHVFRVSNRLGLVKADNVLDTEKQLERRVPQNTKKSINKFLVLFGRYVCKAKNPLCNECPLNRICKNRHN